MWVSGFATLLVALQLRRFLGVVWVLLGKVPTAIRLIRKTTTAGAEQLVSVSCLLYRDFAGRYFNRG